LAPCTEEIALGGIIMDNRIEALEKKYEGQRNEATRLIAIAKTHLEESELWAAAVKGEDDFRRKALSSTAAERAELYIIKAESL